MARHVTLRLLLVILAVGGLAACGDDSSGGATTSADSGAAAAEVDRTDDEVDRDTDDDSGSSEDGAGTGSDFVPSAEARITGLQYSLPDLAEGRVEGDTLVLRFSSGTVNDPVLHCIVAGALLEAGERLLLEYPDGSTDCDLY